MAKLDTMFQNSEVKKPEAHPQRITKWIHYSKLVDNKAQYCNEKDKEEIIALADLIEADQGVLQNLLIRKIDTDEYEIIAGHKRRRAVRYLVEERKKEEFAFIPCTIENISAVRAEFQLYSSNSHHDKTDYEKMHELERMKYLLENFPEEFPNLQTGRMVERLAQQMHMSRTTVGEYMSISNNLGEKAKEEFRKGNLKKSAALEMSSLSKQEQEKLLDKGVTAQKEIKEYKEKKEPSETTVKKDPAVKKAAMLAESEAVLTAEDMQCPGQLRVANTDMEIEEDVPKLGTKEEYSPRYFLNEQKEKLDQMILTEEKKGGNIPDKLMERQKIIVEALTAMVCGLETSELKKKTERLMQPELPRLRNMEERRHWLRSFKKWGIWYTDENIGVTYYKYDFPDGTRLIAEVYESEYSEDGDAYFHLVGGPSKREQNFYGVPKYPYHKKYCRHSDSETELLEFLKEIQK